MVASAGPTQILVVAAGGAVVPTVAYIVALSALKKVIKDLFNRCRSRHHR